MIWFYIFTCLLYFLSLFTFSCWSITPPTDMLGNLPNYNPVTGEMEDLDFRVAIEPGKVECFYQDAAKDHNLDISYQVIELSPRFQWMYSLNTVADLVIDFFMKDPQGRLVFEERDKQEGNHIELVHNQGVYTLCFDNRRSGSTKLVNVEVYLYSKDDDDRWGYIEGMITFTPEGQAMDTIESIKTSINKVRDDLIKIVHSQDERRAIERRDRVLVDNNSKTINRFSFVSTLLMIVVGLGQIMVIRSLFDEKSHLRKIFKHF
ncbi:transmembrane emp24 domain-containing protein 1-like [Panonychus citri]|uniref:transmembrane emp24 domain-containing protein 1-like n=1 Tax=Panonychus citri TaxID=50023 RepID=UPI0023078523|nr:transmembrane emp24 domain-containing protein 1-like [Panonychus citri]